MAELYSCSILGKTVPSSINAEKIMHLLNRHKLKIFTKTYLSPKFSKYFQAVNRQKACDQVPRTKSETEGSLAWFPASAEKQMRTALFWGITQPVVVIPYPRFGTNYLSHLHGSRILDSYRRFGKIYHSHFQEIPLKMGPKCTETSVRNYYYSLRNSPEKSSSPTALFAFAE